MIFLEPPLDFNPKMEVAACYITHKQKILYLHRHRNKSYGQKWDSAGGKINKGEAPLSAVVREVQEETGLKLTLRDLIFEKIIFVRYPEIDFIFHAFSYNFLDLPEITLNPLEHTEYRWVTPQEALSLDLVPDEEDCIKLLFK